MVAGILGAGKEWRSVYTKRWYSCLRNSVFVHPSIYKFFCFDSCLCLGLDLHFVENAVEKSGNCKAVLEKFVS